MALEGALTGCFARMSCDGCGTRDQPESKMALEGALADCGRLWCGEEVHEEVANLFVHHTRIDLWSRAVLVLVF